MSRGRSTVAAAGLALLASAGAAPPAPAAEYCVTCTGPPAMYACVVAGAAADAPADPREQLVCIAELAQGGRHESCSVPRSAPKPCPGVLKIVSRPALMPGAPESDGATAPDAGAEQVTAQPEPAAAAAAPPAEAPEEAAAEPAGPPKTMEELAKNTLQSSKEGLSKAGESVEKAGSAVGTAAKKTWDCMVSLFSDC